MRIIGRDDFGTMVGTTEPKQDSNEAEVEGTKVGGDQNGSGGVILAGFREAIAWLYSVGASRFECVA